MRSSSRQTSTLRQLHIVRLRRLVRRLLTCGVGALWATSLLPAQEPTTVEYSDEEVVCEECRPFHGGWWRRPPYNTQQLSGIAANAVSAARNRHIRNGQILDRTLWNYHFEAKKAELLPSGVGMLNRLARSQAMNPEMEIFVATAHDLPYRSDDPAGFATSRERLDSQRAKIVREYLQAALRKESVRVLLCDPAPVGMAAAEAASAYRRGLQNATSVIPPGEADAGDFGPGFQPGGFGGGFGGGMPGGMPGGFGGGDPFGGGGAGSLPPNSPGGGFNLPAGDMGGDLGMPMGDSSGVMEGVMEGAPEAAPVQP